MNTIQLNAIALHGNDADGPALLSIYAHEDDVTLTEHSWFNRPSTGQPYPVDETSYTFAADKLMRLAECDGTFDRGAVMRSLSRRARENTEQLLDDLKRNADHCFSNEYHVDVPENEWKDVEVTLVDGATA